MKNPPQQLHHDPVLLERVLDVLAPNKGETYLDLTAGYGGHAQEVITAIGGAQKATLVDRDVMAIEALQPYGEAGATLVHNDFATAAANLVAEGRHYDMILVDLGVSSPQLDIATRGFSIRFDAPLDMRMDQNDGETVAQLLQRMSEQELANAIYQYGEERRSRGIARAIKNAMPIETTFQLRDAIYSAVPPKIRMDAAKRTFQALRIVVNQELQQVEHMLNHVVDLLTPGGRVAVISFHSL